MTTSDLEIRRLALRAGERAVFFLGPDAAARLPARVVDLDLADLSNEKAIRVGLVIERIMVDGVDQLAGPISAEALCAAQFVRPLDVSTCHRSLDVYVRATDRNLGAVTCLVALLDARRMIGGHFLFGRKIIDDNGKEG